MCLFGLLITVQVSVDCEVETDARQTAVVQCDSCGSMSAEDDEKGGVETLTVSYLKLCAWPSTIHFILHTFLHSVIVFFLQHMSSLSAHVVHQKTTCNFTVSLSLSICRLYILKDRLTVTFHM